MEETERKEVVMICYYRGHEVPKGMFYTHGNVVFCELCERRYRDREQNAQLQIKVRREIHEQNGSKTS